MFEYLGQLSVGDSCGRLAIESYWCETKIKLSTKILTPLGSRVSVLRICVDIQYSIVDDQILLERVVMASNGGSIMGSSASINISSDRTGEAWYSPSFCPEQFLAETVKGDLARRGSRLRGIMMGKYRDATRGPLATSLTDALNAQTSSDEIAELIANGGRDNEIVFTYSKPNCDSELRHVTVEGVSGDSIRAIDHKDEQVKSFRIDRITNARNT